MNKDLNIAEILKDKPEGTKLYSPLIKTCTFVDIDRIGEIKVADIYQCCYNFDYKGRFNSLGECLLFPSKEMRDWDKFTWKPGDVLKDDYNTECMFDGWSEDNFTQFNTAFTISTEPNGKKYIFEDIIYNTRDFHKAKASVQRLFIADLEKEYNGKFNPETLEIEDQSILSNSSNIGKNCNPQKELKPFDKVLIRDYDDEEWCASFFSHYADKKKSQAICINDYGSQQCIPYEGNEHLLGTTTKA